MKALISPLENNRICQIEPDNKTFEIAPPLFWTTCPDNCTTEWIYAEGQFLPPAPPAPPTAEQNKSTAVLLLQESDWTTIADVGNPQMSNPYLANQMAFIEWRSQIRAIAVNPIGGNLPIFDEMPLEEWKTV